MSVNFNGEILPAGQAILTSSNRAFRFGDSLFESIRVFEGEMPFFDRHWQRLKAGMEVLKFEIPAHFSAAFFQHEISKLTENQGNWRIRLTVFRSGGGLYTPERNAPEFLIETSPLGSSRFELNPSGLAIGIFDEIRLNASVFSPFKTGNALPNVLAAIFKKEKKRDDCLLLNTAGRIACGSSSNVFLVKNGGLITPPLTEGCVAGTMRGGVLDLCKSLKIEALETPVSPEDLPQADELFLTNAIQGIRWVQEVEGSNKKLSKNFLQKIAGELNASVAWLK
jgi:branched-chain amino acid aminotransferase